MRVELQQPDISNNRKFDLLTDMAWEYTYLEPDSVKTLAERALRIAKNEDDSLRIPVAMGYLGLREFDLTKEAGTAV